MTGVVAVLLIGYNVLLQAVPVPGGQAGDLTPAGNLGAWLDRTLMRGHLWRPDWDPEGLLSTLPAIATTLMGVIAGYARNRVSTSTWRRRLIGGGAACVALGLVWSLQFPINKSLWTSSYVMFTGGLAAIVLAACSWWSDEQPAGWRAATSEPFVALGRNAILLFVLSGLVGRLMGVVLVDHAARGQREGVDLRDGVHAAGVAEERVATVCPHEPRGSVRASCHAARAAVVLESLQRSKAGPIAVGSLTRTYTLCISACVTAETYRTALDAAIKEYERLGDERRTIDRRLSELAQTIGNLSRLLGLVPTVPLGLTDACRLVLRGGLPMTPVDVRDRLLGIGMDLSVYSNDLSAIHTVLKRLNEAGEIRLIPRAAGKSTYLWQTPPTAIAISPEIAAHIRAHGMFHNRSQAETHERRNDRPRRPATLLCGRDSGGREPDRAGRHRRAGHRPARAISPAGPWTVRGEADVQAPPRQTPDADPRHVHHNVAVAIDASRMLFNGAPSVVAMAIDALRPNAGDRVLHIGAGLGYYTALLAHCVGADRTRRRRRSRSWPRRTCPAESDRYAVGRGPPRRRGERFDESFDVILVNAGVTHPLASWLDAHASGGPHGRSHHRRVRTGADRQGSNDSAVEAARRPTRSPRRSSALSRSTPRSACATRRPTDSSAKRCHEGRS